MTGEREARMGLCALGSQGAPALARAVVQFGAVDVWEGLLRAGDTTRFSRLAASVDITAVTSATAACGARFVVPGDDEWPAALAGLEDVEVAGQAGVPFGLWLKGQPLASAGGVAVVGARACTGYGERAATELSADLAVGGRPIISGLAYGIDAAAHRGALGVGGYTAAVVASGVDRPYPAGNATLAAAVSRGGTIISELPPGALPARGAFLARNRIIAALAEAVIVVEAALRSGAKNTASWGNAVGRRVLAVPGPITSSLSSTPHRLIRDGEATLVGGAEDVERELAPLGAAADVPTRGDRRPIDGLAQELREVREAVAAGERVTAAELGRRTGQSTVTALALAAELVELGWLDGEGGVFNLPSRPMPVRAERR